MFKGIFIADLHCSKSRKESCIEVLTQLWTFIKEHKVPLFICGDFWDNTITATEYSGYTDFVTGLNDIIKLGYGVYIIYGTPLHEPTGSLKIFEDLGAKLYDINTFEKFDNFELVAMPEPRKSFYVSECKSESINEYIASKIDDFVKSIPPKSDLPRICIFHNEVVGEKMVNGADCSSPIGLRPSWLKSLDCDFIAGGHIHKASEIKSVPNCYYVGSAPCKNWDEGHDASFMYIEIK